MASLLSVCQAEAPSPTAVNHAPSQCLHRCLIDRRNRLHLRQALVKVKVLELVEQRALLAVAAGQHDLRVDGARRNELSRDARSEQRLAKGILRERRLESVLALSQPLKW